MEFTATLRHLQASAQKVRLVADLIRGKGVQEAVNILELTKKGCAKDMQKLLKSAIANAEHRDEKVDVDRKRWIGRVALELYLEDRRSGEVVWTRQLEQSEPLEVQSPEGLARALSRALDRIARRATPEIARLASQRLAGAR